MLFLPQTQPELRLKLKPSGVNDPSPMDFHLHQARRVSEAPNGGCSTTLCLELHVPFCPYLAGVSLVVSWAKAQLHVAGLDARSCICCDLQDHTAQGHR